MNTGLIAAQVSLRFLSNLPIIPPPTTCRRPGISLGFSMPGLPDHVSVVAPVRAMRQLGFASP
jgi:hypothetical protein